MKRKNPLTIISEFGLTLLLLIGCTAFPGGSVDSVCIQVEQSYPGLPNHTEPIAEEIKGILDRMGIQATIGEAADCEAVLTVILEVRPVNPDWYCYTEAEAIGRAEFSAAGDTWLPLNYTVDGPQFITYCTPIEEAPFEEAWARAVMPALQQWWGSAALLAALRSENSEVRLAGVGLLPDMESEAGTIVPELIEMLGDHNSATRAAAADSLAGFGPIAIEAIPVLIETADDPDPDVRSMVVSALGFICRLDANDEVVEVLIRSLDDPEVEVRLNAVRALALINPLNDDVVVAIVGALEDSTIYVRQEAAYTLGSLGEAAMPAIPALIEALTDEEESVRITAARALENISGQHFGEDAVEWRLWWESQP